MSYRPFKTSKPFIYGGATVAGVGGLLVALLLAAGVTFPAWVYGVPIGGMIVLLAFAGVDAAYEVSGH